MPVYKQRQVFRWPDRVIENMTRIFRFPLYCTKRITWIRKISFQLNVKRYNFLVQQFT